MVPERLDEGVSDGRLRINRVVRNRLGANQFCGHSSPLFCLGFCCRCTVLCNTDVKTSSAVEVKMLWRTSPSELGCQAFHVSDNLVGALVRSAEHCFGDTDVFPVGELLR